MEQVVVNGALLYNLGNARLQAGDVGKAIVSYRRAERLIPGDERLELNHTFFATEDESILSGVWLCAPCKEEIDSYPVHEMMTVLAGSVTVTDAEGRAETYTPGDTFFIPKGAPCTWQITETLRKFYMIAA